MAQRAALHRGDPPVLPVARVEGVRLVAYARS